MMMTKNYRDYKHELICRLCLSVLQLSVLHW